MNEKLSQHTKKNFNFLHFQLISTIFTPLMDRCSY